MQSGAKRSRVLGMLALAGCLAGVLLIGSSMVAPADAQEPLPDCPPPGSLGPGTPVPGPDNVSWRYIQECSHCLAVTPFSTGSPFDPTATASMRVFRADCAQDYVFQVVPGQYQILTENVQELETYGVIFTPHNDGSMLQAAWAEDPQVTWLMPSYSPEAGTYLTNDLPVCLVVSGYEYLCGQFAPPGADVRTLGYYTDGSPYIPHPSYARPLALGINAGGDITVSDVRVIYFGSTSLSCDPPTPTPTATPGGDWSKSCSFDQLIMQEGGFSHHELPVGGTVGSSTWSGPSPLEGYVFYMYTQGAEVSIGPAVAGPSFFDANLDGYQFQDGFYCIGTYDACAVMGPGSPFTWLENTAKDVAATTYYMPFNIDAPGAQTMVLDNGYWIARGVFPECSSDPTPTPSPTSGPTATPVPSCNVTWTSYSASAQGTKITGWSVSQPGPYEQYASSTVQSGYTSWLRLVHVPDRTASLANGYVDVEIDFGPGTRINTALGAVAVSKWNGAGSQSTTYTVLAGSDQTDSSYVKIRVEFGEAYPYFGSLTVTGESTVVNVGPSWTVAITECSGGIGATTPTPTPTQTSTPFPTWTPAVSPTPTATPLLDPDRCREWDWKPAYPPVISLGDDFGDDLLEEGECYGVIPGMNITVPDLGKVGDLIGWEGAEISWDPFGYCVTWVNIPDISILGLSISADWFLLPAVAWLLNKLVEMS